jgi:hypothetical protein
MGICSGGNINALFRAGGVGGPRVTLESKWNFHGVPPRDPSVLGSLVMA